MKPEFPANREILKKVQKSRRLLRQISDNLSHEKTLPGGSKQAIGRRITGNLEKTNRDLHGCESLEQQRTDSGMNGSFEMRC
jgi:hypothetical protein